MPCAVGAGQPLTPAAHLHHPNRVTERGNYTEKDAANIIRQILSGVAYLHSKGARAMGRPAGQAACSAVAQGSAWHLEPARARLSMRRDCLPVY